MHSPSSATTVRFCLRRRIKRRCRVQQRPDSSGDRPLEETTLTFACSFACLLFLGGRLLLFLCNCLFLCCCLFLFRRLFLGRLPSRFHSFLLFLCRGLASRRRHLFHGFYGCGNCLYVYTR